MAVSEKKYSLNDLHIGMAVRAEQLSEIYNKYMIVAFDSTESRTGKLVFCGDIQDMLILAMEVVKLNYSGFFSKLAAQFGGAFESLQARMKASTAGTAS